MYINLLYIFLLTITLSLTNNNYVRGQSFTKIEDPTQQLETVLKLSENFGKDTLLLKKIVAPVLDLATQKKSIPLKWAYYMLMADGYSIAFDQTNPTSDHYYILAHQLLQSHPNTELEMIGYARQGYYNFVYRKVIDAFPFFLHANDLKTKINIKKIPLVVKHYQFMASFFNYIGDQTNAINFLKDALPFSKKRSRERIDLINAIAVYLSEVKTNPEALNYLNQAMQEAKLAKDSVWIGIISGNLADYAWEAGEKNKAIDLLKKNIDLSLRYNEEKDAMRANLNLAQWYITLKEWDLAKKYVSAGKSLMEEKPYFLKYKMDATKYLSEIAHGLNQKENELGYLKFYFLLRDSLEKRTNVSEMQKIIWQSEKEKYNQTMKSEEEKRLQIKRMYQYCAIFLTLIFVIVLLLINKSRAKIKMQNTLLEKDQLALSYENQLLDQELIILKDSLNEFTDTIKQNNSTIQQLRHEINEESNQHYIAQINDKLNIMLQDHIMTDDRWIKFKYVFDKVYPGYLLQMRDNYTKISENDIKILALQKLGLNNKSMSNLLCVSLEGIKKAKQRLKKKIE